VTLNNTLIYSDNLPIFGMIGECL